MLTVITYSFLVTELSSSRELVDQQKHKKALQFTSITSAHQTVI